MSRRLFIVVSVLAAVVSCTYLPRREAEFYIGVPVQCLPHQTIQASQRRDRDDKASCRKDDTSASMIDKYVHCRASCEK